MSYRLAAAATKFSSTSNESNQINGIEFVKAVSDVAGGYDLDHEFLGYRKCI